MWFEILVLFLDFILAFLNYLGYGVMVLEVFSEKFGSTARKGPNGLDLGALVLQVIYQSVVLKALLTTGAPEVGLV